MKSDSSLPKKFLMLSLLKGRTQVELARRIAMQPSNLNHYLRGKRDIYSRHFVNILKELGVDIEELVNREIAYLSAMELERKVSLGDAFESVIQSLGPTERKTLLRHVIKMADLNLGQRAKSEIQALKGWTK